MKHAAVIVAAVALAACSEATPPDRECSGCIYSFAFPTPPDSVIFHWPQSRMPVRYWADPRGNMRFLVQRAISAWEEQFLYGEFSGVLVADSTQADVLEVWGNTVPADVPPDTGAPVQACDGLTHSAGSRFFVVDSASNTVVGPLVVELDIKSGYTPAQVAACVRRVAIHETGHSLGLLAESPYLTDIMNGTQGPLVDFPSAEDQRTVQVLYHTAPNVLPPPR